MAGSEIRLQAAKTDADGYADVVTYANGERMYFNYDPTRSRTCEGVPIPPLGWKLVK